MAQKRKLASVSYSIQVLRHGRKMFIQTRNDINLSEILGWYCEIKEN